MSTQAPTKERGWPAYPHEVRAILDDRQSQFRRVIKLLPGNHADKAGCARRDEQEGWLQYGAAGIWIPFPNCPFGKPGDRLWVREKFSPYLRRQGCWYWADGREARYDATIPEPSIHMPRWASRINLEVTSVRVERVQEITVDDMEAEGTYRIMDDQDCRRDTWLNEGIFMDLWDSINAKRGFGWDKNPWTWVVSFERIKLYGVPHARPRPQRPADA